MITIEIETLKSLCLKFMLDGYWSSEEINNATSQGEDFEDAFKEEFDSIFEYNLIEHKIIK